MNFRDPESNYHAYPVRPCRLGCSLWALDKRIRKEQRALLEGVAGDQAEAPVLYGRMVVAFHDGTSDHGKARHDLHTGEMG